MGGAIKARDDTPLYGSGDEIVLGLLPFYHVSGLGAQLLGSLITGATLAVLWRFQPEIFLKTIQKYKVDYYQCSKTVITSVKNHTKLF